MTLIILNPGVESVTVTELHAASRTLPAGSLRIGLLANGKANAAEILEGVRDALASTDVAEWIAIAKGGPTTAISPSLLARVRAQCNAVVAAVGD